MTHHPIKILPDGTRVYSNYTRYKPKTPEERVNRILKPDVEGAVFWSGKWRLPLDLLPDELRQFPETVPDEVAYDHAARSRHCRCPICRRPTALKWRRRWFREHGGKS